MEQKENERKIMSWMEIYSKEMIIKEIISELFEQYNLKSIKITP